MKFMKFTFFFVFLSLLTLLLSVFVEYEKAIQFLKVGITSAIIALGIAIYNVYDYSKPEPEKAVSK